MVHVCGGLADIAAAERAAWTKTAPERPFVLVAQPSLFDATRTTVSPGAHRDAGKHIVWAYCHVPNGCRADMTARIEAQIERFAPGFRDRIRTRHAMNTAALERHDENYIGGDIAGGSNHLAQIFLRPIARAVPYATPNPRIFMCSSSTPPGAGVHGMCGWFAARVVLRRAFGRKVPFTPARDLPTPVR
jgi:phytoene dehydrogenase-like protein